MIDETHAISASSWVEGADAHPDFPVQNLPLGIFSTEGTPAQAGTAIGGFVLDLAAAASLLGDDMTPPMREALREALRQPTLNALLERDGKTHRALRRGIFRLLTDRAREAEIRPLLHRSEQCRLHLPVAVRDFTDFYAGIHHARAVGSLLRPDNPLLPNYRYVPVGYHGRASTVGVSGGQVVRPCGQTRPATDGGAPGFGPSARLDYEVELGLWIRGGSRPGLPIPIGEAAHYIAGFSLLNDWSARDVQAWEYVPLGPFLAKNFATTVGPWIVTAEALAPFRRPQPARPEGDPAPLPYLSDGQDQRSGAFDIRIDASLRSAEMRDRGMEPIRLGRTSALHLYWTAAQLIAHHTVNGCDLAAGDLLGTGTISGPEEDSRGSLMEITLGGRRPIRLPSGETRLFLEDGDEVIFTGWAEREGCRRIGFGICAASIIGAGGLPLSA